MSLRPRSVRKKILLLALIPILSLSGLYVFTTAITGRDVIDLAKARALKEAASAPVGNFLGQVGIERLSAAVYLSAPSAANLAALQAQEARTTRVVAAMRSALTSSNTSDNASAPERGATAALLAQTSILPSLRAQIAARSVTRQQAFTRYNAMVADGYLLLNQVILNDTSAPVVAEALALVRMGRSEDMLQQENLVLLGDMAAHSFPVIDQRQFSGLVGARRALFSETLSDLAPAYRAYYARDVDPQAVTALRTMENDIAGNPHPGVLPAVSPQAWGQAVRAVAGGEERAGAQAAGALDRQAVSDARATDLRLITSGGVGLLAVAISILVSILIGRGLARELRRLRDGALEVAGSRLPGVVSRLAAGASVDPSTEVLQIPAKSTEIAQVADAFAEVQHTAVEAAVGQARLRDGISDVFKNLARRSQSLLHRQLNLIDTMERRARDPQLLEDLFRVDHLTTRMRRHAENLILLSGHAPGRGWRNPVQMQDVVRAAVTEVEDYARVKVIAAPGPALAGEAVGDVIHLLAELIENATVFSPPNTPVLVTGDSVGHGYAVEIEDRGLGLSDSELDQINGRLASPPPFDLSGTDQLGLFVASQLAKRHQVKISLRPSPYGGTSAVVLIPHEIVVAGEGRATTSPAGELAARELAAGELAAGELAAAAPPGARPAVTNGTGPVGAAAPAAPHGTNGHTGAFWPSPVTAPPAPAPPAPAPPVPPRHAAPPGAEGPGVPQPRDPWEDPAGGLAHQDPGGPVSPPESPEGQPAAPGGAAGAPHELPRRVRQASLAEQLRGSVPYPAPPAAAPPRAPEETRATMSALQQGWERGRSVFDPVPPPAPPAGAPSAGAASSGPPAPGPAGPQEEPARPPGEDRPIPGREDEAPSASRIPAWLRWDTPPRQPPAGFGQGATDERPAPGQAWAEHGLGWGEQGQAGGEHGPAWGEHGQAGSEHGLGWGEHGQAGGEHGPVWREHGQAGAAGTGPGWPGSAGAEDHWGEHGPGEHENDDGGGTGPWN